MSIDWEHLKRLQELEFPNMEHLEVCVCTQGPGGYILDYDCGREITRRQRDGA